MGRVPLAIRLIEPINPNAIVILGVYTVLWGMWLLAPWWDVFTSAALFSYMHQLAPEVMWGSLAVFCGLAILYGVFRPSFRSLWVGAMIGALHWLNVAIMYGLGDWTNTGMITSFTFFVYAAYVYVNIRVNKLDGNGGRLDAKETD